MDKQGRVSIPENIRKVSHLDPQKETRIYLDNTFIVLSNELNLSLPCFGIVNFDAKFRFFIPSELRKHLNITPEREILIYSLNGLVTIEIV